MEQATHGQTYFKWYVGSRLSQRAHLLKGWMGTGARTTFGNAACWRLRQAMLQPGLLGDELLTVPHAVRLILVNLTRCSQPRVQDVLPEVFGGSGFLMEVVRRTDAFRRTPEKPPHYPPQRHHKCWENICLQVLLLVCTDRRRVRPPPSALHAHFPVANTSNLRADILPGLGDMEVGTEVENWGNPSAEPCKLFPPDGPHQDFQRRQHWVLQQLDNENKSMEGQHVAFMRAQPSVNATANPFKTEANFCQVCFSLQPHQPFSKLEE